MNKIRGCQLLCLIPSSFGGIHASALSVYSGDKLSLTTPKVHLANQQLLIKSHLVLQVYKI